MAWDSRHWKLIPSVTRAKHNADYTLFALAKILAFSRSVW